MERFEKIEKQNRIWINEGEWTYMHKNDLQWPQHFGLFNVNVTMNGGWLCSGVQGTDWTISEYSHISGEICILLPSHPHATAEIVGATFLRIRTDRNNHIPAEILEPQYTRVGTPSTEYEALFNSRCETYEDIESFIEALDNGADVNKFIGAVFQYDNDPEYELNDEFYIFCKMTYEQWLRIQPYISKYSDEILDSILRNEEDVMKILETLVGFVPTAWFTSKLHDDVLFEDREPVEEIRTLLRCGADFNSIDITQCSESQKKVYYEALLQHETPKGVQMCGF